MCFRSTRASAQAVAFHGGWEAAAGFESLADPQDRVTLLGWTADAAFAAKPWLWAVVETGRATRTIELITLRQLAVLAGLRARAQIGPFVEFVQVVAGAARSESTVLGDSSADTAVALQPGIGVDLPLGSPSRWLLRVQIDRRSLTGGPFHTEDRHNVRIAASIVFARRMPPK